MSLLQWKKFWRRNSVPQRPQRRMTRLDCEPLESRKMLALLGITPTFPIIAYDSNGVTTYTVTTDSFDIDATPLSFKPSLASPTRPVTNPRDVAIHVLFYTSVYTTPSKKLDAELLALALNVYVTKSSLGGNATATSLGFAVSSEGLGIATVNVGSAGAAFGVDENAILTVWDLLYRTNQRAKNGVLWDADGTGSVSSIESILRAQALSLFDNINNT